MTNVRVVRAYYGQYTELWVKGGYAAIGWIPTTSLAEINSREELSIIYKKAQPEESGRRTAANVGMASLFLLGTKPGDYIITPALDSKQLYHGKVLDEPYYYKSGGDECPFPHRRRVKWASEPLHRSELSTAFQETMRTTTKTVFNVIHVGEFLTAIGRKYKVTLL